MRTKLTALLAGLALFGLAGVAQADALTPTDVQPAKSTETQLVMLTDAQLDNATAGFWSYVGVYYFRYWYNNQYWESTGAYPLWIWL